MTKILITIEGGNIQDIRSTDENIDICVIDYDLLSLGESPVYKYDIDGKFKAGEAYTFIPNDSMGEMEVRDELKDLKF